MALRTPGTDTDRFCPVFPHIQDVFHFTRYSFQMFQYCSIFFVDLRFFEVQSRRHFAVQHCGGQHFALSTAEIMGPAEDFGAKANEGLGDDVHLGNAMDITDIQRFNFQLCQCRPKSASSKDFKGTVCVICLIPQHLSLSLSVFVIVTYLISPPSVKFVYRLEFGTVLRSSFHFVTTPTFRLHKHQDLPTQEPRIQWCNICSE